MKVIKQFMDDITLWINKGYPLNDEFKEMVKDYKEEIEELEGK